MCLALSILKHQKINIQPIFKSLYLKESITKNVLTLGFKALYKLN